MNQPWYKQFWPWFLIALPSCVVIASFTTLFIFSQNSVSLVAEDYYKKGKGINIDLSRINQSKAMGVAATLSSTNGEVMINFNKGELDLFPALIVTFTHRTLANKDFQKVVSADAKGIYSVTLDEPLSGPWFVEVEPHTKEWLLQGKVSFPIASPTLLTN